MLRGPMKLILLPVMLAMSLVMGLAACASSVNEGSTDKELSKAKMGVTAASITLSFAELGLNGYLNKPDTPAWQVAAARLAVNQAKLQLERERARLDELVKLRQAQKEAQLRPPAETVSDNHDPDWRRWLC
jgi:hypothetical protein